MPIRSNYSQLTLEIDPLAAAGALRGSAHNPVPRTPPLYVSSITYIT